MEKLIKQARKNQEFLFYQKEMNNQPNNLQDALKEIEKLKRLLTEERRLKEVALASRSGYFCRMFTLLGFVQIRYDHFYIVELLEYNTYL